MSVLWTYFWPAFAAGLLAGVLVGIIGFRRGRKRAPALALGLAASLALAALWHGPLGAADRLTAPIEPGIRNALAYYEMGHVSARLQRGPLTRRVILSGRADDFQRSELARLIGQVPGVSSASWSQGRGVPLMAEAGAVSFLGFLLGLLLAYLIELRRRHNAQWNW